MIVRERKPVPVKYLYCAGAVVGLVLGAIAWTRLAMVPVVVPGCIDRYDTGIRFSLDRKSGEPLTAADLQGRLAGRDWGLNENVRIRRIKDGPAPVALEVALKQAAPRTDDDADRQQAQRSGMGFTWLPKSLPKATTACLGYSIWVPADFDHGAGGVLPGLFGNNPDADDAADPRSPNAFAVRMHWNSDGGLDVVPATKQFNRGQLMPLDPLHVKVAPGRWLLIEEELWLNDPGQANGRLRVFIDGVLRFDEGNLALRSEDGQHLLGVVADVHYSDFRLDWAPARKSTRLLLSPLELRLK